MSKVHIYPTNRLIPQAAEQRATATLLVAEDGASNGVRDRGPVRLWSWNQA
jgi:hypothetical protein